jgi:sulfate permease, SulP family
VIAHHPERVMGAHPPRCDGDRALHPKGATATRAVPSWLRSYERSWLRADAIAGLVIWSVVTPQAVAYAQIAGLPPQAGLMAAPGALLAYALIGTSRQLVVGATTSTAAVSAAAVGTLADGDVARFAALSAALALVTATVFVLAGLFRLGALADFISKPVMTGFLFGLGLVIALGQLPSLLGVKAGEGNFFPALADVLGELGDVDGATLALGAGSIAVIVLTRRLAPMMPSTLLVLVLAIGVSALLDLSAHGVAVVGDIPDALPDPAIPQISADDFVALVTPAFGVMVLSAEGLGVARALAVKHGYQVDPNRDLIAFGGSNLLAGLSSGFVQCGGASQTAAADGSGGRTQLAHVLSAGLILLTGAFLAPLFEDLPKATLAAIVIVAVSGFFDVAELRRFAHVRRSAIVLAVVALAGVLGLGVLQGLVVAAGLSLIYVIQRISRPSVGALARDPATGAWGRADRHDGWRPPDRAVVARSDGPLLYPNANAVKDHLLALVAAAPEHPRALVLDLSTSTDIDIQTADTLDELRRQLARDDVELRLAAVRAPARQILDRTGVSDRVRVAATIDEALADRSPAPGEASSPKGRGGSAPLASGSGDRP